MTAAGVLTVLHNTTYLGSHPRATRRVSDVDIAFTESGLSMRRGRRRELGTIPWATVTELSAAPWDSEERRTTFSRFLFLGMWAFFLPQRTTYAYLTVADGDGEWAFAVPDIAATELRAGLVALQPYVPHPAPAT